MRSRESAKLPIARAAMPMFSPSCGSTRMTTGPASAAPDLVLSVPEPDISLHFLMQHHATPHRHPFDCLFGGISQANNGVSDNIFAARPWRRAPPRRLRPEPKDGLKVHSASAFARASAVLYRGCNHSTLHPTP